MKTVLSTFKITRTMFALAFYLSPFAGYAGITANGSAGQSITAYTNGSGNVPIFVWCTNSTTVTPASLTCTPSNAGSYTYQWQKHDANTSSWASFGPATFGSSSTISNLGNGGYRVEVRNGSTVMECFHAWVWNLDSPIVTKAGNCGIINLAVNAARNDTFIYYNPPPPPSVISAATQITVCFSATHTAVSDLGFYLIGPISCGSPIVALSPYQASCNSGNNVSNLCFSSASSNNFNVCNAPTPLTGTFGTYGTNNTPINWSPLYGCDASLGGWRVQIYDCEVNDVGSLTNATLNFYNLPSICGSPTSITYNSGAINSAINDLSCTSATASVFTVPSPYSIPIKTYVTKNLSWSSPTPGVNFTSANAAATMASIPPGNAVINLQATYVIGTAQCITTSSLHHINSTTTGVDARTICQGQSYTFNGVVYTVSNSTAKDTLPNATGCDSVITLNLTVLPNPTATRAITICQGQSYMFNGVVYTASNNMAKDTVPGVTGCDSIITLNLTVIPYLTGTRIVSICQGQSYSFNGVTYTVSNNTAKDTIPNSSGCDSLITLNLTVNPYVMGVRTVSICQGASYTFDGVTYTSSNNTAKDTIPNTTGCDSLVTLNLTVMPYLQGIRTINICQGESYTFNGVTYAISNNTAKDTIHNNSGCDSLITLNLTVFPLATSIQTATICDGESYFFNGVNYTTSNHSATDTFLTIQGCDSIVSLDLTVLPPALSVSLDTTACGLFEFKGHTYTTSTMIHDTVKNINDCDSLYQNIQLTVYPAYSQVERYDTVTCDSFIYNNGVIYDDTLFTEEFKTVQGCDSLKRTWNVRVEKFDIDLSSSSNMPWVGESITLNTSANMDYRVLSWAPSPVFSYQAARSQSFEIRGDLEVVVTASSLNGCTDTAMLALEPFILDYQVFLPTAFTPNGDGRNDYFRPVIGVPRGFTVKFFRVFNRWGQEVYQQVSQVRDGWDGTFKGVPVESGVYYYWLEISFSDGKIVARKGDVTLIR